METKSNQKKAYIFRFVLIMFTFSIVLSLFSSCEKKDPSINEGEYAKLLQNSNSSKATTHRWFYFTQDGFKETDIPRNAPEVKALPWTQAVRITSSAFIEGTAYFAVNKLGLLKAPQTFGFQKNGIASKTVLIKNEDYFSNASVGSIFNIHNKPTINFFTNTIFENANQNNQLLGLQDPFLIEFNTNNYEYTPLLSMQTLTKSIPFAGSETKVPDFSSLQIREVLLDSGMWNILFKSNENSRTDFYALHFSSDSSNYVPETQRIQTEMKTVHEYREIAQPKPFNSLPRTIQDLLQPVPSHVSYYLNYTEENSPATQTFEHSTSTAQAIQGYALGLEHCSLAIFEDGTICFAGALPSKNVLDSGITQAFKLPDLGAGYIYGPMALSGSTLIVSWEETSFYETKRSGFLAIDMEQVLYTSIEGE